MADGNDGRRNLLAGTLEREGFEVMRGSTLRQVEATALATMPEVVVIEAEWGAGNAIDSATRLMSDPEFEFKCRIVILSRDMSQDFLTSAARAGVNEVLEKPLDIGKLIEQLWKHSKKQFVPPPADIDSGEGGEGSFMLNIGAGGESFALPMLQSLLGPETINEEFVEAVQTRLMEKEIELADQIDQPTMSEILKVSLNQLIVSGTTQDSEEEESDAEGETDDSQADDTGSEGEGETPAEGDEGEAEKGDLTYESLKSKGTLGGGAKVSSKGRNLSRGNTMEDILQGQADALAEQVEDAMGILDEVPEGITFPEEDELIPVDPEALRMALLAVEYTNDLLWSLARPGALENITLMTQIENAAEMMDDITKSLPTPPSLEPEPIPEEETKPDETESSGDGEEE